MYTNSFCFWSFWEHIRRMITILFFFCSSQGKKSRKGAKVNWITSWLQLSEKKSFTTDQKILCFSFLLLFHRWFFSFSKKNISLSQSSTFSGFRNYVFIPEYFHGRCRVSPHQKLLTVFESCGQKSKLNFLWCKILVNYCHFHFHFLFPTLEDSKYKKTLVFQRD